DVTALQRKRNRAGLDGRGGVEAHLRNRKAHRDAQAQLIEADRLRDLCRGPIDRDLSGTGPCDVRSSEPHSRTRTQDRSTIPDAQRSQTSTIAAVVTEILCTLALPEPFPMLIGQKATLRTLGRILSRDELASELRRRQVDVLCPQLREPVDATVLDA